MRNRRRLANIIRWIILKFKNNNSEDSIVHMRRGGAKGKNGNKLN